MAQEINLGGTIYISSKRAAEMTGYTQDYVGQLARGGHIVAQRISGLWYVVEQSLRDYKEKADQFKPEPPKHEPQQDMDASVSFDGKDYVSAQRAAKITGYHQDYVGQLARSGKILSRQVGNRWYVDREGIVEHKKHNDALLAAVPADSVGLQKVQPAQPVTPKEDLHFTYIPHEAPQMPISTKVAESEIIKPSTAPLETAEIPAEVEIAAAPMAEIYIEEPTIEAHEAPIEEKIEEVNEIPIRVIRPRVPAMPIREEQVIEEPKNGPKTTQVVLYTVIAATVLLGAASGFLYFSSGSNQAASAVVASDGLNTGNFAASFVRNLFSKELHYERQ